MDGDASSIPEKMKIPAIPRAVMHFTHTFSSALAPVDEVQPSMCTQGFHGLLGGSSPSAICSEEPNPQVQLNCLIWDSRSNQGGSSQDNPITGESSSKN